VAVFEEEELGPINFNPEWQAIEHQVYVELCALRANPSGYSAKVEQLKQYYHEETQSFIVPGGVILSAQEGWAAYQECIDELRKTAPLPPLQYSRAATLAAMAGLTDQNKETPPRELLESYGVFSEDLGSSVAQSLCFNQLLGQSIVLHLIIDDSYESRGNRRNLLSEEYQIVGISFNSITCNVVFASNYIPKSRLPEMPSPTVPDVFDYSLELNNTAFRQMTPDEVAHVVNNDVHKSAPAATADSQVIEVEFDGKPLQLTLLSPINETVEAADNNMILMLSHSAGHLTASLTSLQEDNVVINKGCLIQSKDGIAVVYACFPGPGAYKLSISADLVGEGVYTQVFDYKINATCGKQEAKEFPATFLQSHGVYVYSPKLGTIPYSQDEFCQFVVHANSPTAGIAVLSGEELMYLQEQKELPNVWAGKVKLSIGPCKISSNLQGTHYEVLGLTVLQ
jgi:hypothetical protein